MPERWCQNCRDPRCCYDPMHFQLFLGPPNFAPVGDTFFWGELVVLRGAPVEDSTFFWKFQLLGGLQLGTFFC